MLDKGGLTIPDAVTATDVSASASISTPTVTIDNAEGADQTLTASGAIGDETITTLSNFTCTDGIFGATTVKIGDQTLSESGVLVISDALTPGVYIKDTGDTGDTASAQVTAVDNNDAIMFTILCQDDGSKVLVGCGAAGGDLYIEQTSGDNLYLGQGTGTVYLKGATHQFDASDVNFANGSTYKVEADGDATFKTLTLTDNIVMAISKVINLGNHDIYGNANTHLYIDTEAGKNLYINTAALPIDLNAQFQIRDADDGNAILLNLDTSARTLAIGAAADGVVSSFGDGGTTNYAQFAADGELTLIGTARVKRDLWLPFTSLRGPGSNPAVYADHGISGAWVFADGASEKRIIFNVKLPNDMDKTVAPSIAIGWSTNTAVTTETCVWQLEYLYRQAGEDTTAAGTFATNVGSEAIAQANGLIVVPVATLAVPHGSDICLHCRLTRRSNDAFDDLTDTAELHGVCMEYTSNKLGTAT